MFPQQFRFPGEPPFHSKSGNPEVVFDPDKIILEGRYADELSAHRARRVWIEALENNFLLEEEFDYSLYIESDTTCSCFLLRCEFVTACARYAFWRLTNHQAPEAQYQIETAHIPECYSRKDELLVAPDMHSITGEPTILCGLSEELEQYQQKQTLIQRFIRQVRSWLQ